MPGSDSSRQLNYTTPLSKLLYSQDRSEARSVDDEEGLHVLKGWTIERTLCEWLFWDVVKPTTSVLIDVFE